MKKSLIPLSILLVILIFSILYLLENSSRFNKFVFNSVNPFNPLKTDISYYKNKIIQTKGWTDPRGIFPIFAYNLPGNSENLVESLKIIENGGINLIINGNLGWMPDPEKLKIAFKELKNSKLQWIAIIENECKDDFIYCNSNDETNKDIIKYLDFFNDEFLYGWYIWDEPGKNRELCSPFNLIPNDDFKDINRMVKQLRNNPKYNTKLDFINLFPTYWDETETLEDYENYLNAFFDSQEIKPRVLCFDHYPFLKEDKGGFRKDYYSNLEIIRKKSIEWNIPFWMIILSSGHDNYINPTFEQIRFQVYSALAYGAKGIGYYLYSKSFGQIGYRSWILENFVDDSNVADSLHGPLYLPVKKLNDEIQKLGVILTNLNSKRILHTSNFPNDQLFIRSGFSHYSNEKSLIKEILPFDSLSTQRNILIGEFTNKNLENSDNYFLIVNKDFNKSCNVKIVLSEDKEIYSFDKNLGKFDRIDMNNFINLNLLAGDGELLLLK
jgi:hypothetical protein